MPHRLNEFRAKIQFVTHASWPKRIYEACLATGHTSNTRYIQHAVAEALSRDLGIPLDELLAELPPSRGAATALFGGDRKIVTVRPGAANTVESVR